MRTLFTLLSIVVAFILFGYLLAIEAAFSMGVDLAGTDRLVMIHKVSLIQLLPISYEQRIRAGARASRTSCHQTWFGGIYQDPKNFFAQMPGRPRVLAADVPGVHAAGRPEAGLAAPTARAPSSAARTADRFGWKVGDRIPLQATIWRKKDNSHARGSSTCAASTTRDDAGHRHDAVLLPLHYFDESRLFGEGDGRLVHDPDRRPAAGRRRWPAQLDALFANSPAETKTTTEKAFAQAFAKQIGDIGLIVRSILAAVFFTILLVAGNTMAQSVRERTSELAVLKTLGFTDGQVLALVLVESCAARGGRRTRRPGARLAADLAGATRPAACCPGSSFPARALAAGARAGRRASASSPASSRPSGPCGCASSTRCGGSDDGHPPAVLAQIVAVTAPQPPHALPARLASSAVAVVGIAGVVGVLRRRAVDRRGLPRDDGEHRAPRTRRSSCGPGSTRR